MLEKLLFLNQNCCETVFIAIIYCYHYFLAFSVQNIIKNILEKYRSDKSHNVSTKGPILYFIEGKFPSEDINSEEKICICCSSHFG